MPRSSSTHNAVLFVDITGSTRLFAEVGDAEARKLVAECLDSWGSLVNSNGGKVVQLRGDGLLSTFPDAESAVRTAIAIRMRQKSQPLSMHAGVNVGSFMVAGEQLYGDVVNVAARVADIAKSDEIVVTAKTMARLPKDLQQLGRLLKKVPVRGSGTLDLHLITEHEAVTEYLPPKTAVVNRSGLQLTYRDQVSVVNDENPEFVIGRVADCDLVIDHQLVSRHHAIIECKRGKFFLQDQSTNGTYVKDSGAADAVVVQRELVQLKGNGIVTLGVDPGTDDTHCITFEEID